VTCCVALVRSGRKMRSGAAGSLAVAAGMIFGLASAPLLAQAQTAQTARPAQAAQGIAGTWQGTVGETRIVLKISKADGAANNGVWKGGLYDADSGEAEAIPSITLHGADVRFAIVSNKASYEGKLSEDGASIAGTFTQDSHPYALNFVRVSEKDAWAIPKPDAMMMAKDADPAFEVATVKPTDPTWTSSGFHQQGRHISCDNETVRAMIQLAYAVSGKQIVGAPDWLGRELYDIDGVPDIQGVPNSKQMMGMYQKILADRFQLKFHREKRELSVYALTVTKSGPKLAKSLGDPNGLPDETGAGDKTGILVRYTNVSMEDFAANMQTMGDGRPVVDQTGLAGKFDFMLKWSRGDGTNTDPNAAPELFTALQEQLGLKMEGAKAMVDVIVIDHVERPSAN